MKQIEAVIFDWAGTTVDYGCMAPIVAMENAFANLEIDVTLDEIRKPMGLGKREHIATILDFDRVKNIFHKKYQRCSNEEDIDRVYHQFEKQIFSVLENYTNLIDGVLPVQNYLRDQQIKIGSTTGYTEAMIEIVAKNALKQGYHPDCIITPDQTRQGRPYPYMLQQNLMKLGVKDVRRVIKVGDTVVDIQEGLNSGCWSVGVIKGSSMLGLIESEVANLSQQKLQQHMQRVRYEMLNAGAHYVIESMNELPQVIDLIK